jgi:hypothetical protein
LMLDIPALAFGLGGFACFVHAIESEKTSWRWVLLSGFLLGFALQTKYNSVSFVVLVLLWGFFQRTFLPTLLCILISILFFLSWECYVGWIYGQSHFWYHFAHRQTTPLNESTSLGFVTEKRSNLIIPLLTHLGGLASYLLLLAIPSRWVLRVTIGLVFCYLFIILSPSDWQVILQHPTGEERLTIRGLLFFVFGVLILVSMFIRWKTNQRNGIDPKAKRSEIFLLLWVVVEILIAWLMSPFAASRRLIGSITAITFLMGFLCQDRMGWRAATSFAIILGVFLAIGDGIDASVEKEVAEQLHQELHKLSPPSDIWFCGHWGFSFYAQCEGMKTIFPNQSQLREGDWLIVPDVSLRPATQRIQLPEDILERWDNQIWSSRWPIRTIPEFYGGKVSFRPWSGPRMMVQIFRVRKDFLARMPE